MSASYLLSSPSLCRLIGYARISSEDQLDAAEVHELKAGGCAVVQQEHGSGAHAAALSNGGTHFQRHIVSAASPSVMQDCKSLSINAASAIRRGVPNLAAEFAGE